MMRLLETLFAFCVVVHLIFEDPAAHAQANGIDSRVEIGLVGSVAIPSDASVKKDPNDMPDFSVYFVQQGSRTLVGIYLGSWPDFPPDISPQNVALGNCIAKMVTRIEQGATSGDYLVRFNEVPGFPQMAHFYYRATSAEGAKQADKVIRSFRVSDAAACG